MMVAAAAPKMMETTAIGADCDHVSNEFMISLHRYRRLAGTMAEAPHNQQSRDRLG
jgi:hypothetical protein